MFCLCLKITNGLYNSLDVQTYWTNASQQRVEQRVAQYLCHSVPNDGLMMHLNELALML